MSETGRKSDYDAAVLINYDGEPPCDADHRVQRFYEWVTPLITGTLFPLLEELSVDSDDIPVRTYPCVVPVRSGDWRLRVKVFAVLVHGVSEQEVMRRLGEEFLLPLRKIVEATLAPLPAARSFLIQGAHPKQAVGYLPYEYWRAMA